MLRGYRPKTRKAPWTTIPGAKVTQDKKRAPIRKRSKVMTERMKEYNEKKADFLRIQRLCERCFASLGLHTPSTEIHHQNGRSGDNLLNTDTWVALCRSCHRWIHDHPALAREGGWLAEKGEWNKQPKDNT